MSSPLPYSQTELARLIFAVPSILIEALRNNAVLLAAVEAAVAEAIAAGGGGGGGGGGGPVTAIDITDSTVLGRDIIKAPDSAAARGALGIANVNNTTDLNKPVSIAQQAAINAAVNALPIADGDAISILIGKGQDDGIAALNGEGQVTDSTGTPIIAGSLPGSTPIGRAVMTAANTAAARDAIGAGQADAYGEYLPIYWGTVAGVYPGRPATLRPVIFNDPNVIPANDGSTAGGGGMVPDGTLPHGLSDMWIA